MQQRPRPSILSYLALALVFFSPLLGVAIVRHPWSASGEPAALLAPSVRAPRPSEELQARLPAALQHRLVLRFSAGAEIRLDPSGELASRSGLRLGELPRLFRQMGARLVPLVRLPEAGLRGLQERAQARTGSAPVDFMGMFIVELPPISLEALEALATGLQTDPLVEQAEIQVLGCEPPDDPAPATPNYVGLQGYRALDPGIDAAFANARGFRGRGVRVSDCEYGWNPDHEDLRQSDLQLEPGHNPDPAVKLLGYDEHGTAVAGIIKAGHNGFGIDGIAPDCDFHMYPEWSVEGGFRRVESILSAAIGSAHGDVLLLEMQSIGAGGNYGPAELDPLVFAAVRLASDAGVIVVAAAGNGAEDLDSPAYQAYRDRGPSGAILVGAGSADASHQRLGFSSFGQRVDMQGWGSSVFTSGYGHHVELGGDPNQRYTSVFSGTSSAAALVAGMVAVLQSAHLAGGAQALDGAGMRALLLAHALPQGAGEHIGPAPQLRASLESLPWVGLARSHKGSGINPEILSSLSVPLLGQSWQASIDVSAYPDTRSGALVFSFLSSAPIPTRYGELLLDPRNAPFAVFRAAPQAARCSFSMAMPSDPAAIGLRVHGQGVVFARRVQLTNSLEARLGLQ